MTESDEAVMRALMLEGRLRQRLRKLIAHARSKTPCAVNYNCLLNDLEELLRMVEESIDDRP